MADQIKKAQRREAALQTLCQVFGRVPLSREAILEDLRLAREYPEAWARARAEAPALAKAWQANRKAARKAASRPA